MPETCAVMNCKNRRNENTKLSFYRFPAEKELRGRWLAAIERKDWTPQHHSRLCSAHFISGKRSLNPRSPDYVPSIFNHTPVQERQQRVKEMKDFEKRLKRQLEARFRTTIRSYASQNKSMEASIGTSTQKRRTGISPESQGNSRGSSKGENQEKKQLQTESLVPESGQVQVHKDVSSLLQGVMDDHSYSCRQLSEPVEDTASTSWIPVILEDGSHERLQEDEHNTPADVAYLCPYCDECFSTKPSLNAHIVTKHSNLLDEHQHQYMRCDLCGNRFECITGLVSHMTTMHKINLRMNAKEFRNEESFARWMNAVERDCKIEVEKHEDYEFGDDIVTWYLCRRKGGKRCGFMHCARSSSGHYKAQCCLDFTGYGKMEKPQLKPQEVIMLPDEEEEDADQLPNNVRKSFESAAGVSAKVIARQKEPVISVHGEGNSLEGESIDHLSNDTGNPSDADDMVDPLLPSEEELDTDNVSDSESLEKYSISSVSVCDWVRELMDVDPSSVLLYKTQGSKEYGLGKGDFLLGLQTEFQADMLRKYGHRCIYTTDSSSKVAPEVKLTTVMVLDDIDQKIPVASLITSKRSSETLGIFFQALHKRVGEIQTDIFLTDDSSLYDCVQMRHFSRPSKILLYRWVGTS